LHRIQQARWVFPSEHPGALDLGKEYGLHPLIAEVLITRGLSTKSQVHDYLYGQLPDLLGPELFPDMDKAVDRIVRALNLDEPILVYGDNDVDGMTATALFTDFLLTLGAKVFYYVPNRTALKQSLILDALQYALTNHCTIIITVDCGITAAKEIAEVVSHNVSPLNWHTPSPTIFPR
jgi:single-stranded-DNA-specific exonuclease